MKANIKNRRRVSLQVEPLEGKIQLSAGLASHHAAMTAAAVAQAASLSGTLTGFYSNVHIPFGGYLLNYSTSGTLSGPGSTHLNGSIFVRPSSRGRVAIGQFAMRNDGGLMILRVFRTPTPGTYTYRVIRATGGDVAFKGGTRLGRDCPEPDPELPVLCVGPGDNDVYTELKIGPIAASRMRGSRNDRSSASFWKLETGFCRSFRVEAIKVGRRTEGASKCTSMSTITSRDMSALFVSGRARSACGGTFPTRRGDASTVQMLETPLKSAIFRHVLRRAAAVRAGREFPSCRSSTGRSEFSGGLSGSSIEPWQWKYQSATVRPGACSLCLTEGASTGFDSFVVSSRTRERRHFQITRAEHPELVGEMGEGGAEFA